MQITQTRIYLTDKQCQYLENQNTDQVISMTSDDGWIFVEAAANVGEEGSGVWVDANGEDHFGPTG